MPAAFDIARAMRDYSEAEKAAKAATRSARVAVSRPPRSWHELEHAAYNVHEAYSEHEHALYSADAEYMAAASWQAIEAAADAACGEVLACDCMRHEAESRGMLAAADAIWQYSDAAVWQAAS